MCASIALDLLVYSAIIMLLPIFLFYDFPNRLRNRFESVDALQESQLVHKLIIDTDLQQLISHKITSHNDIIA